MKTGEFGLRFWHYTRNGIDMLSIKHDGKTQFADPDRLRDGNKSWSLQRVAVKKL